MTETTERGAGGRWPITDRSLLATVLGVSPVVAVGVASALTGLGVFVDLVRIGSLGAVFTICYVIGCLLAVAWVRRDGLFGPLVQPPLLVAVAVPVVVLLAGFPKPGAGVAERLLVIGAPLVNAFPTMAWTTGLVLALGVARIAVQKPLEPADKRRDGHPTPSARARPGRSARADTAASAAEPRGGSTRDTRRGSGSGGSGPARTRGTGTRGSIPDARSGGAAAGEAGSAGAGSTGTGSSRSGSSRSGG